jgi:hypothetical protein
MATNTTANKPYDHGDRRGSPRVRAIGAKLTALGLLALVVLLPVAGTIAASDYTRLGAVAVRPAGNQRATYVLPHLPQTSAEVDARKRRQRKRRVRATAVPPVSGVRQPYVVHRVCARDKRAHV